MDKETYLQGFRLAFENAQRLFNASETLETKREFAIANSLLILSAEEAMKAYTVLTQHFFPEKILDNFDKSFEDHKHKLDSIRSLTGISQIFKKFNELIYDPILENLDKSVEEISTLKSKGVKNAIDWLNNEIDNNTELSKQNIWWKHAKTMKENGFYVSFNKGKWTTPASTKKTQYLKSKKYVGDFLSQIEILNNIDFNDKVMSEMITQIKNKIKEKEK